MKQDPSFAVLGWERYSPNRRRPYPFCCTVDLFLLGRLRQPTTFSSGKHSCKWEKTLTAFWVLTWLTAPKRQVRTPTGSSMETAISILHVAISWRQGRLDLLFWNARTACHSRMAKDTAAQATLEEGHDKICLKDLKCDRQDFGTDL